MLTLVESGVHVKRKVVLMVKRAFTQKLQMLRRHLELDSLTRLFKILFAVYDQRLTHILLKSALSSSDWCNPNVAGARYEVQQHLFMVTSETSHPFGIVSHKPTHVVHTARRVWTAINQIAQEDKSIGGFVAWQHLQQTLKLLTTAVDISDYEGFHALLTS